MKLQSFLNSLKVKKTPEEVASFVKEHMKNEYIPYEKKADVAKAIIDASCWIKDKDENGNTKKVFHIDSVAKYMLTCMSMVELYTDIERSKVKGNMLDDFNALNRSGVLDLVVQNIDDRELKEFNMVLQLTYDDLMTNEYELHSFIGKQTERFGELLGAILLPVLSQLDLDKVADIAERIGVGGMNNISEVIGE